MKIRLLEILKPAKTLALGLASLTFLFGPLSGQVSEESEEEVFELSPFEVEATTGWVATETLAGSRLRTEYRDLAGQFETLTMEFMDDYSVNSAEDAAIYSLNMESRDEYVSGAGIMDGLSGELRIRGLTQPTNSVNFFSTSVPGDNYNIDRLTIASGPNSILFGTGSPAGIVDSTLKKAEMSEFGTLKMQVDSFEGYRGELDFNKEIFADVFSVRLAALYDSKRWDIKEAEETDERIYGTFTFRPFKNTTIRGHYERYSIWSNRPSRLYPFDRFTPWFDADSRPTAGYPAQHIFQNDQAWLDTGQPFDGELFETQGGSYPTIVGGQNIGIVGDSLASWDDTVTVREPANWSSVPTPYREADGYTVLDNTYVPTDYNFSANMKSVEETGDVYNLFLTQKVTENLFFEFGYKKEDIEGFNNNALDFLGALGINVDANAFLPDGVTPNPNVGRFYMFGIRPSYTRPESHQEDIRATVSYEFDFTEKFDSDHWLLSLLGRHRLAGLASRYEKEARQMDMSYVITPLTNSAGELEWPSFPGVFFPEITPDNIDISGRNIAYRYYLSEDDWTPDSYFSPGKPFTIIDANGVPVVLDAENTGSYDEYGRRLVRGADIILTKTRQDSVQFAYQGFFWNGRIIATYGYREDRVGQATPLNGFEEDSVTGLRPHPDDINFEEYDDWQTGITRTTGVVVHPVEGLVRLPFGFRFSAFYNESDTFQPNTGLYTPFGGTYPGASGSGRDKGFAIRSENDKFILRYNEFVNTSGPQRAANVPFNRIRRQIGIIERRLQQYWPDMPTIEGKDGEAFINLGVQNPYAVVSDKEATGRELSVDWNPNRNWNFRLTWTEVEAVETNIGTDWFNDQGTGWLDQRLPVWESLNLPVDDPDTPRDPGTGITNWTWDTITWQTNGRGETIKERYEQNVVGGSNGLNVIKALDGKSNEFVRNNRLNLNVMYRFTEGRLNNLRVGGAIRYREGPLLNYGITTVEGVEIIDLNNPVYGEDEIYLDLTFRYSGKLKFLGDRRFTTGLTVRNATNEGDIVALTDGDGNPRRIARVDGRQYILSLQVDF